MNTQTGHKSKRILSRTDHLLEVREFVGDEARAFGFSEEDASNIVLAVDEACTNIIKHAYQYATDKEIEVSIVPQHRSFEIRIFDSGRSFDPSTIRQPDLKEHIGHHKRGGLGVYMMKRLMDKVEYNFHKGKRNEVRLIKFRSNASTVAGR
ncbi:MAG: ATP-binding protein [Ignavibacteriae bacterium]|nr:MAG: ATP-binding protein [Ignavibacteriota bacterium]